MKLIFFFGMIALLISFLLFRWSKTRKKAKETLSIIIPIIEDFQNEIIKFPNKYVAKSDVTHLKEKYESTNDRINSLSSHVIKNHEKIQLFITTYNSLEEFSSKSNATFIVNELNAMKIFFQNIDGKSLDKQQQEAVIVNEDTTLVLAGAGSGKTLTISAKVKYLVERLGVHPDEILLISYTSKSAAEMTERIGIKLNIPIVAKTFHKLGLQIITSANKERPDVANDLSNVINDYFKNVVLNDPTLMGDVIHFYSSYLSIPKNLEDFTTLGEYHEDQASLNLETLRSKVAQQEAVLLQKRTTLKMERVKSLEEVIIANFLFLNGIEYEYEKLYPYQADKFRKSYRPDFYLSEYDIYLEHFGVTADDKTPWLSPIEEQKYIEDMKWKRSWHLQNETKLIETYSYYNKNGLLLEKLKSLLIQHRVTLATVNLSNVYSDLLIKRGEERQFKEFKRLIATFITLFKSNGFKSSDFLRMKDNLINIKNPFLRERTKLFLSFVSPIYQSYENDLQSHNSIDFNDMIHHATTIVNNSDEPLLKYKYIIIDEYQDISMGRYSLIKAIKEQTQAKLMCVGDDWQSIFRFAGSDLQLFYNFEKYYGFTKLLKIERTYRNSQELIDIVGDFIMKNKKQFQKNLLSNKTNENPIQIFGYDFDVVKAMTLAIEEIVSHYGTDTEIMIIGRNNMDLSNLTNKDSNRIFIYKDDNREKFFSYKKYPKIRFIYTTVHRSKGLEAENVIIINLINHLVGFPNKISDDSLLSLVLTDSDEFMYAEERRLFYVALSRTKNHTYLITPQNETSIFVEELIKDHGILFNIVTGEKSLRENPKCPVCLSGHLTVRESKSNGRRFLGCSNYPQCSTTFKELSILENPVVCTTCDGYMIKRNGSKGEFYGCKNYPFCKNSFDIQSET